MSLFTSPSGRREVSRGASYDIVVVGGAARFNSRDLYHVLLRMPWWCALALTVAAFLLLNAGFALGYLLVGGVANAAPGSFADAFFFSVETMGTIGYGAMYPVSRAANLLMVAEAVAGLLATALATGLVFARFSQTRARVVFSSRLALGPLDGHPTLMLRLGNERRGRIVGVSFRLTLARTVHTVEGVEIYRYLDLPLVRERAPSLARAWMVIHRVEAASPLHGDTAETLARDEAELTLEVSGVDEVSGQAVHAQYTWPAAAIAWGARLADVLSSTPDGNLLLDLRRFHEVTDVAPAGGGTDGPAT